MNSIHPVRVNHLNAVVEDFEASTDHFKKVYDAETLLDLPFSAWHASVISIGGVLFELFAPTEFFLHSRFGPHYFGIEHQADLDQARKVVAERGIRIGRDIKSAIHTDPRDGLGISFEFWSGEFHSKDYDLLGGKIRPLEYWRDEHPLGLTGLKGYTVAVPDIAAASSFFQEFLAAKPDYEAERPAIGARAVGLRVADAVVELLTPTGEGFLRRELERLGPGIHSTIFGVESIERARAHLRGHGIELVQGSAEDRWAVAAEANRGLIFEFAV